jgi:hypothetical protein
MQRQSIGFVEVPKDPSENIIIHQICDNIFLTATRLPNQRLQIKWKCSKTTPKQIIIEYPRMRKHVKNIGIESVQLEKSSKMELGNYDENGDSFPIDLPIENGYVILSLYKSHLSLIGVFCLKPPTRQYVIFLPKSEFKKCE